MLQIASIIENAPSTAMKTISIGSWYDVTLNGPGKVHYYRLNIDKDVSDSCNSVYITTCCALIDEETDRETNASNARYCDEHSLDTYMALVHVLGPSYSIVVEESYRYFNCSNPRKSIIRYPIENNGTFEIMLAALYGPYGLYSIGAVCVTHHQELTAVTSTSDIEIISRESIPAGYESSASTNNTNDSTPIMVDTLSTISIGIWYDKILNGTVQEHYYKINIDEKTAESCGSVYVTTCCGIIDSETDRETTVFNAGFCNELSLDTDVQLLSDDHKIIEESYYFPECTNTLKSKIRLSNSNDYYNGSIFRVSGYQNHNGSYSIGLICSTFPKGLTIEWAIAMIGLCISAIIGFILSLYMLKSLCKQSVVKDDLVPPHILKIANARASALHEDDEININDSKPDMGPKPCSISMIQIKQNESVSLKQINPLATEEHLQISSDLSTDSIADATDVATSSEEMVVDSIDANATTIDAESILQLSSAEPIPKYISVPSQDGGIDFNVERQLINAPSNTNRCKANQCATKIATIDRMITSITSGSVDIYQIAAIYKAIPASDMDDVWELGVYARLVFVLLLQTLLFSLGVGYSLSLLTEMGTICFYRAHYDTQDWLSLLFRNIAFIVSLAMMLKMVKVYGDLQNGGLYRALHTFDKDGMKKLFPNKYTRFWIYFGQLKRSIVCILCAIGSAVIIFEARYTAIRDDGSLDVFQSLFEIVYKPFALYYVASLDKEFISDEEKEMCVKFLRVQQKEIIDNECESWKTPQSNCNQLIALLSGVGFALVTLICW